MKKFLYLMLTITSFICLASCSEDDDNNINSLIVGVWIHENSYLNTSEEITFYKDSDVKSISKFGEDVYKEEGEYSIEIIDNEDADEKGILYISWDEEDCICDYAIIDNELVWQMRGEEGPTVWKRK